MAASDLQQVLQHLQNRTQLLGHHGKAVPFASGSSFVEDRTTTLQEQLLAAEERLLVNGMLRGSPCDRVFPNRVPQIDVPSFHGDQYNKPGVNVGVQLIF